MCLSLDVKEGGVARVGAWQSGLRSTWNGRGKVQHESTGSINVKKGATPAKRLDLFMSNNLRRWQVSQLDFQD